MGRDEIREMIAQTVRREGRIDVLVNCAGISKLTRVPDITEEEWDRVLAINLRSVFFASREALAHMIPHGITVNCVCPVPTETPLTEEWGEQLNAEIASRIPLKRYATTREVAQAICFLASAEADCITGETMDVNGGFVMD